MSGSVFNSFHYKRDSARVNLVLNMGVLAGQPVLSAQEWEQVKRKGDPAIQEWIDDQMAYKKAVIVLLGQETATRRWVHYEINRAWSIRKPLLGIRIHGLADFNNGVDSPGNDPFTRLTDGPSVPIFDPTCRNVFNEIDSKATYHKLQDNLATWAGMGVVRL